MADSTGPGPRVDLEAFDLGVHYGLARQRLSDLVGGVADPARVPVPACPNWSVHDVIAHLVAVVEDVLAGRLTGPPSEQDTAAQVTRRQGVDMSAVLEEWTEMAPPFESLLSEVKVWPGFLDILAHEHDVRGALSAPAGRDSYEMEAASECLVSSWMPDSPVLVRIGDDVRAIGPETEPDLTLTTTAFEAFRFRLGRRSRAQLRAMDWSGDPGPVLDTICIFGPEPYDVIE